MQEKLVPAERLSTFGLSIGANRRKLFKETSAARYGQKRVCEGICSEKTMVRIEQGGLSRNLDVYGELAERLGLKAGYYPKVEEVLEKEIDALYRAVEYCDFEEIEKWTTSALKHLEGVKNHLWYKDVYEAYKILYDYYVVIKYPDLNMFLYLLEIVEKLDIKLCELIKIILYKTGYYLMDDSELSELFEKLELRNYSGICTRINVLMNCYYQNETSNVLTMINDLESDCIETKNYERLADIYDIALSYSACLDNTKKDYYIDKLSSLIDSCELSQNKMKECHYTLGLSLYEVGKYRLAADHLMKIVDSGTLQFPVAYVVLLQCSKKLHVQYKIPKMVFNSLPNDLKLIIEYFTLPDDIADKIRQKFLIDKVVPKLQKGDEFSVNIVKEELLTLISKTGMYKDLLDFTLKEKELLNDD